MSKYKAMIIYSSISGNTEKIANAFADTFREYNIEPTLRKLEGNYIGEKIMDYSHNDYDIVCFGTPVIASIPYHDFYIEYGAQDDYGSRSFGGAQGPGSHAGLPGEGGGIGTGKPGGGDMGGMPMGGPGGGPGGPGGPGGGPGGPGGGPGGPGGGPGGPGGGPGGPGGGPGGPGGGPGGPGGMPPAGGMGMGGNSKQLRIAFCTYGGFGEGPTEATASLETIKELFQGQGFVGFFACPGAIRWNDASERISKELKINKFRAQELIVRYLAGKTEYFTDYTPEQMKLFEAAAGEDPTGDSFSFPTMADNDPLGTGQKGSHFWSYDLQNRPNENDVFMAQAFLKDVIEDYFLTTSGEPNAPSSAVYWSIN